MSVTKSSVATTRMTRATRRPSEQSRAGQSRPCPAIINVGVFLPVCVAVRFVRVPGSPANWCPRVVVVGKREAISSCQLVARTHARTGALTLHAAVGCCCDCENPFVNYDGQVGALKLERSVGPVLAFCALAQIVRTTSTMPEDLSVSAGVQISWLFSFWRNGQLHRLKSTSDGDSFYLGEARQLVTCD